MACDCDQLYGSCCCGECLPPEPSQGSPGQQGEPGSPGEPGASGVNSYSTVTVASATPAVGNTVVLTLATATWVIDGQNLYIDGIGYYEAISHTATTVTVENLGAPGNAAPATAIPIATGIGPAGYEGPALIDPLPIADGGTGQATAISAFNALSPTTTNGDIIARLAGSNTRLAVGSNGQVLLVSGGLPAWGTNAPVATNITGILPIANGGTNANSAATARTNLDVPGLNSNNSFVGSNTFGVGASTFRVSNSTGSILNFQSTLLEILDLTNVQAIRFDNRSTSGQWSFPSAGYVTANSATYNIGAVLVSQPTSIVVSTYSTTGSQAITLPAGTDGRQLIIKDGSRNCSVNNITISRSGSDTIEGATTYVLNNDGGVVKLMFFAATTDWKVM